MIMHEMIYKATMCRKATYSAPSLDEAPCTHRGHDSDALVTHVHAWQPCCELEDHLEGLSAWYRAPHDLAVSHDHTARADAQ